VWIWRMTTSDEHLLICNINPTQSTKDDLIQVKKNAIDVATHWLQYQILQSYWPLILFIYFVYLFYIYLFWLMSVLFIYNLLIENQLFQDCSFSDLVREFSYCRVRKQYFICWQFIKNFYYVWCTTNILINDVRQMYWFY